ncbi:MAG: pyridoxamine 5'-phosphate oxidase family protein [Ilumatobacteraceae bacterium]
MTEPDHDDPMESLSVSECFALLRTVDVGRIAVVGSDEVVDIFPVNFVVDHGTVVFRTAPGTKIAGLTSGHRVAFEADNVGADGDVWSVVLKGEGALVARRTDLVDMFDLDVDPWHKSPKPNFVRVTPTETTGRRLRRPGR